MRFRGTAILGRASAHPEQMRAFVRRSNAAAADLAPLYLVLGRELAVRGDVAFAQAVYETGDFREVGPAHNYGGLGMGGPGSTGAAFATPAEGVLAHLQRLYAYATASPLPGRMPRVDPGFDTVQRGSAPYTGDLGGRWQPETSYGRSVERILGEILTEPASGEPYQITRAYLETAADSGGWQGVKGLVIHRMGGLAADAWTTRRYLDDLSGGGPGSSHFVVDDQVVLHVTPIGAVARHSPGRNFTHLGIAICEHNWGSGAWGEAYRKLVWLTGYLVGRFQLSISEVAGRFFWEPVQHANDPTHLGWTPAEGRAGGLFDWNQLIGDVQRRLAERESIVVVEVEVAGAGAAAEAEVVVEPVAEAAVEAEPAVAVAAPELEPEPEPAVAVAAPPPSRGRRPARPSRPVCRARGQRKW